MKFSRTERTWCLCSLTAVLLLALAAVLAQSCGEFRKAVFCHVTSKAEKENIDQKSLDLDDETPSTAGDNWVCSSTSNGESAADGESTPAPEK